MFGKNKKLKPDYSQGKILKVNNIFKTLQGEGPFVGYPAIFLRLSGCNLACYFCDTEFDSYQEMTLEDIIIRIEKESEFYKPLIVITGGEPLRQNISPLCKLLIDKGYLVQLETNGTLMPPELPREVKIVCSPKPTAGRYYPIREDILERALAVKFLIDAEDPDYQQMPDLGQSNFPQIKTYLQALDRYDPVKNQANLALALKLALEKGVILSLQTHKILSIE